MMSKMKKDKALATIESLPEEFDIEDLVEKLLFVERVEEGLKQADEGKTITLEEARQQFERKWQSK